MGDAPPVVMKRTGSTSLGLARVRGDDDDDDDDDGSQVYDE